MNLEHLPDENNVTIINENQNLPEKSEKFDIETFKSIFYWANAKPDTQLKLFRERKIITLSEIYNLNTKIGEKLKTHKIETFIVSLNFILTEGNIREYSNWAEFERENWQYINQRVQSISITWDLTFSLPNYTIPQRHTLKVRIGSAIPPKDILHFMLNTDDVGDFISSQAEGLVKVDFINQILGNELLNIVTEWNEGLKKIEKKQDFQTFFLKNSTYIKKTILYAFPLILLYIGFIYQNLFIKELNLSKELNLITLERTLLIGATIISAGLVFSRFLTNQFARRIDKFKISSGILITKGDENYDNEIKRENKSIIRDILARVFISLVVAVLIISFKYLYSIFFGNR